jgi:hypothetical protein
MLRGGVFFYRFIIHFEFKNSAMNYPSIYQKRIMWGLLLICQFYSCEKVYDAPPTELEAAFAADMSIKELRAKHVMGKFEQINEAKSIVGVVVADDASDNFYKSLVVQDSTGGITIRMDGIKLSANYPIGRKLSINLKGLWLGDYGKLIQLGAGVDISDPANPSLVSIPQSLFDQIFRKGEILNSVPPLKTNIGALNNNFQSRLVQLDSVEFVPLDSAKSFADFTNKLSVNRTLRSCNNGTILIRTSGYASFANAKTPIGNGVVTGIYSVFGTTKQLILRDQLDLQLNKPRCK